MVSARGWTPGSSLCVLRRSGRRGAALLLAVGMIGYFAYQLTWRVLAPLLQFQDSYEIRALVGNRAVDAEVPGFEVLRRLCFEKLIGFVKLPYFDTLMRELGWVSGNWLARTPEGEPVAPFGVETHWWQYAVVGVVMLLLWSVVGGALARVHAVRIARDRSIPWDDGFAFSFSNLRASVQAPLFVILAAGNETTQNALTRGVHALLQNPDQREMLRKNPALVVSAAEVVVASLVGAATSGSATARYGRARPTVGPPSRPMWPVINARLQRLLTLSTPQMCSVMPSV